MFKITCLASLASAARLRSPTCDEIATANLLVAIRAGQKMEHDHCTDELEAAAKQLFGPVHARHPEALTNPEEKLNEFAKLYPKMMGEPEIRRYLLEMISYHRAKQIGKVELHAVEHQR